MPRVSSPSQLYTKLPRCWLNRSIVIILKGREGGLGPALMVTMIRDKPRPQCRAGASSPAECIGCKKNVISANPSKENISTSFIRRQNLTMRMSMRRFTRLTNGFSKKWDNLNYMLAIYFAYYNFCRSHKTLNDATPAMAANLTSSIWTLKDFTRRKR